MIDHHEKPKNFADLEFSYPKISSTCEIVYNILYNLNPSFINEETPVSFNAEEISFLL